MRGSLVLLALIGVCYSQSLINSTNDDFITFASSTFPNGTSSTTGSSGLLALDRYDVKYGTDDERIEYEFNASICYSPPSSMSVCACPNCNYLRLTLDTSLVQGRAYSAFYTKKVDLTYGFETSYTYIFDYASNGLSQLGSGFSFAIQGGNNAIPTTPLVGYYYGLNIQNAIGVVTSFGGTNRSTSVSTPLNIDIWKSTLDGTSIKIERTDSMGGASAWFSASETKNFHNYTITYDALLSPPLLSVYGEGALVLQRSIDLSRYFSAGSDKTAYVGFTAGLAPNLALTSYIKSWSLRAYGNDTLYISCPAQFALWINGVSMNTSNRFQSSRYSAFSAAINFKPGDVIAFQADPTTSAGCFTELRINAATVLNTDQWVCSNTTAANFYQPSFGASSWSPATILGYNSYTASSGVHIANIHENATSIWSQSSLTTTYCRIVLPRYCTPTYLGNCINREVCGSSFVCVCPPPNVAPSCDTEGLPNATGILPIDGSSNGGTPVVISGNNIASSDVCSFDGVAVPRNDSINSTNANYNAITCITPAKNSSDQIQIGIQRIFPNGSIFATQTFNYTYTPPLYITKITPPSVSAAGGTIIQVTGSNFVTSVPIDCYFDGVQNSTVRAVVYNSTFLTCLSPKTTPVITYISITRNGADFAQFPNFLSIYDASSPYCRDYRDKNTIGKEFDFVSTLEGAQYQYFPTNVAYLQPVTSSAAAFYFDASELTNEDFCCQLEGSNFGKICGGIYNVSTTSYVNITITLRFAAYVNEIVTSWHNPCFNLPFYYSLYAQGYSDPIKTRYTAGNSSCASTEGDDSLATALCVDYFNPVQSQVFYLVFNNTIDNLPSPESDGSWLYEIALQGQYLDIPILLNISSSNGWLDSSSNVFPSSNNASFGRSFGLTFFGIGVNGPQVITTQIAGNYTITMKLYSQSSSNSALVDVSNLLVGQTTVTFQGAPPATLFQDVVISNAPKGSYVLGFSSPQLSGTVNLSISITTGTPAKMFSNITTSRAISSEMTMIDQIVICVSDSAGNVVTNYTGLITLVGDTLENLQIAGETMITVTNASCAYFNDVMVMNATVGNYQVVVQSTTLGTIQVPLTIVDGPTNSLEFQQSPPTTTQGGRVLNSETVVIVRDYNGNLVNVNSGRFITVTATAVRETQTKRQMIDLGSTLVVSGLATFSNLSISGTLGSTFRIAFTVSDNTDVALVSSPILILTCTDNTTVPDATNSVCVCRAGYSLIDDQCTACPVGFYKDSNSNEECLECDSSTTTYVVASVGCYCKSGSYRAVSGCQPCPAGGVCSLGTIVGTLPGYWKPPGTSSSFKLGNDTHNANVTASADQAVFYPCYSSSSPSSKEINAAQVACPGNARSLQTNQCGIGYTGIKCLVCESGYGHSGPFCDVCPEKSTQYGLLTFVALIVLAFLVFLVYQGRGPKNKESVSIRILLNHIQMLALLSGIGANWSDPFQSLLFVGGATSFVDTPVVLTDCAVPLTFYQEFLMFMLIPWATITLLAIIFLGIFIARAVKEKCSANYAIDYSLLRSQALSEYVLSNVVILFLLYPGISVKVLDMFDCSVVVQGVSYLRASPKVQCYTSEYNSWLVLAFLMLFLFCIGTPLLALVLLWRFRKNQNPQVMMIVRFFYDGYKAKYFYWEIVIILRKFLLVVVLIVADGAQYQIYGFVWILQASLIAHILYHPYISGRQFKLELMSLVGILVTIGASLFIPTISSNNDAAIVVSFFLFLLNIIIILSFIFIIIRGTMRRFVPKRWAWIMSHYNRILHRKEPLVKIDHDNIQSFLKEFLSASDEDREALYAQMEEWWRTAPKYKQRRILQQFAILAKGTRFQKFAGYNIDIPETDSVRNSMTSFPDIDMNDIPPIMTPIDSSDQ